MKHRRYLSALSALFLVLLAAAFMLSGCSSSGSGSAQAAGCGDGGILAKASREEKGGWVFIHIEGAPGDRGYQYGHLCAPEIDDFITVLKVYLQNTTGKDWDFYRNAAATIMAPRIEKEYMDELAGIAAGLQARGMSYDVTDMIASNANMELSEYYLPSISTTTEKIHRGRIPKMRCSAFIATGSCTKDGNVVMGHNSWDDYIIGQRGKIILDIKPSSGYSIIMQAWPGFIDSGTDFYVNSAGIVITETTIGNYSGFDTQGVPEFVRARKAAQYSASLDDFVRIMRENNNGAYANSWLIGDVNTREIGKLELGLVNSSFYRSRQGYYDGENYVDDSKMIRDECSPTCWDTSQNWPMALANTNCVTARRLRWNALMTQYKGTVDVELGKQFEADQYEQALGRINPGGLVLMARMEITNVPEMPGFEAPRPFGANDAKVVDATLAKSMSFWARIGHPDGSTFTWDQFLIDNPQFAWEAPYLKPLEDNPWTLFSASGR
ncbi:MAG: C45 family peptidase [Candidatus Eremiobacteraeota bacterium]|nr:C45 family peptidase [Candidatus Eremiobacteraeota bacterium]